MNRLFFSLLTLVLQWFRPRYNAQLQLLQAQIRILRSRIDISRIIPTSQEEDELLRLGALVGHDAAQAMRVDQPHALGWSRIHPNYRLFRQLRCLQLRREGSE